MILYFSEVVICSSGDRENCVVSLDTKEKYWDLLSVCRYMVVLNDATPWTPLDNAK